jgi:hypothetical protein
MALCSGFVGKRKDVDHFGSQGLGDDQQVGTEGLTLPASGEPLPPPVTRGIPRGARRVVILSALLLVPAFALSWIFMGSGPAIGLLGGGALAVANLWVLSRLVVKSTTDSDVHWASLSAQLFFKFALLGACLWVLVVPLSLDVFGLLVGLSVVLFGAVLGQIFEILA